MLSRSQRYHAISTLMASPDGPVWTWQNKLSTNGSRHLCQAASARHWNTNLADHHCPFPCHWRLCRNRWICIGQLSAGKIIKERQMWSRWLRNAARYRYRTRDKTHCWGSNLWWTPSGTTLLQNALWNMTADVSCRWKTEVFPFCAFISELSICNVNHIPSLIPLCTLFVGFSRTRHFLSPFFPCRLDASSWESAVALGA